jgi:hypothetical protein
MRLYLALLGLVIVVAMFTQAAPNQVISVFGRTGSVKAVIGDYNTSLIPEASNQYFTNQRARASIQVASPLVYDPFTGIISCPRCLSLDANGDLVIPGAYRTSSTEPGVITIHNIAIGTGVPVCQDSMENLVRCQ